MLSFQHTPLLEPNTEATRELLRVVPLDWQPAAFLRAKEPKGRQRHVTARAHRLPQDRKIRILIDRGRQEVEHSPVVPEIDLLPQIQ